ncbi:MAG TPA: hypothetical protein VI612_05170 [Candidatus Nanoarchaeia archaeon]|nr:hypothetical protein [Candidatus Nanoarchaeia archaeon]
MTNFEKEIEYFRESRDKLGKIFEKLYPVGETDPARVRMAVQITAMLLTLENTLSDLNTRLVVLESK